MPRRDTTTFGATATSLSRNPLGIIALFLVLVYFMAGLVLTFGPRSPSVSTEPLVWFLVGYPVLVLFLFGWPVSRHHTKLYAPTDFKEEKHFVAVLASPVRSLPLPTVPDAPAQPAADDGVSPARIVRGPLLEPASPQEEGGQPPDATRGMVLIHRLEPRPEPEQGYDIAIWAMRPGDAPTDDVLRAAFALDFRRGGTSEGRRIGHRLGVKTSTNRAFLCTCTITFRDGATAQLSRFIDLEMGEVLRTIFSESAEEVANTRAAS